MIIDDGKKKDGVISNSPNAAPHVPVQDAVKSNDVNELTTLIRIMAQREARLAQSEQAAIDKLEAVKRQRAANANSELYNILHKQSICTHLKGGKHRMKNSAKDYAVYAHTFIDGVTKIKCQICGMKWVMEDTDEYLVRHGKQIPNHTGIGWRGALAMVGDSTNKESSSEIPNQVMVNDLKKKLTAKSSPEAIGDEEVPQVTYKY